MPGRTIAYGATGVGQLAKISNGIGDLCDQLESLPGLHVTCVKHTASFAQHAAIVAHELEPDRIIGFGHSRGGLWIVLWCWCLLDLECEVDCILLADAWKAQGAIHIPPNVRRVESWTQHNNRPRGSAIELADASQTAWVHHPDQPVRHVQMDEIEQFRAAVLAAAKD